MADVVVCQGFRPVHSSMSPKGVEHKSRARLAALNPDVHSSMSPKGVEHREALNATSEYVRCIHQCRRKALSTSISP